MLDYCPIVHRCILFINIVIYRNPSFVNKTSSVHLALNLIGNLHMLELNLVEVRIILYVKQNSGHKEARKSYLNFFPHKQEEAAS